MSAGDSEVGSNDGDPVNPFEESLGPAVAVVDSGRARRASLMTESPVRPVAYIDQTPPSPDDGSGGRRRILLVLAAGAAIIAAFLLSVWLGSRGGESAAGPAGTDGAAAASPQASSFAAVPETDALQGDAVLQGDSIEEIDEAAIDGEQITAPQRAEASDTPKDTPLDTDTLLVADVVVVNGRPLLAQLAALHQDFASDRGAALGDGASCWFGSIGGAVLPNVYCGPIMGSAKADVVYDGVPVSFEPDPGGATAVIATAVPALRVSDQQLPDGARLVGLVDPPGGERGVRAAPGE